MFPNKRREMYEMRSLIQIAMHLCVFAVVPSVFATGDRSSATTQSYNAEDSVREMAGSFLHAIESGNKAATAGLTTAALSANGHYLDSLMAYFASVRKLRDVMSDHFGKDGSTRVPNVTAGASDALQNSQVVIDGQKAQIGLNGETWMRLEKISGRWQVDEVVVNFAYSSDRTDKGEGPEQLLRDEIARYDGVTEGVVSNKYKTPEEALDQLQR